MSDIEELKECLNRAADIADTLDRRLWVLAVITKALEPAGITPILVGGGAVEFYTFGHYQTYDIDVAMPTAPVVDDTMAALGFRKSGRYWMREDIETVVEAPASNIFGDPARVKTLDLEGMSFSVIAVEDLIIDRLNAYVHWRSEEDGRWAERMLAIHNKTLDWSYLESFAEQERVHDALRRMRAELADDDGQG